MTKEKLTIEYDGGKRQVNSKMDKEFGKVAKKFGYKLSGTGFDLQTQKRDLGFYKEV